MSPDKVDPRLPDVPIYKTTAATLENLRKAFPRTVDKLVKRKPVHVVVIGDDLVRMTAKDETDGNVLLAWPGQFVAELAREFNYTGGVRVIQPEKGQPDKLFDTRGDEITLRVFAVKGGTMPKAMSLLSTYGAEAPPDLLIVGFGLHDEAAGTDLMTYAKTLHQVIDVMRPRGVDMLLTGPVVSMRAPFVQSLALGSPLAGIAADTAVEADCAFADLGDLSKTVKLDAADIADPAQTVAEIEKQCRNYFERKDGFDPVHPTTALHTKVGQGAFRALAGQATTLPWMVRTSAITRTDAEHCTVSFTIENTSKEKQAFNVVPLGLPRWAAQDKPAAIAFKAHEKKEFTFTWARQNSPDSLRFPAFPGHEALLRLPLLIAGAGSARVEQLSAEVQPVAVLWKLDSLFNQQGRFTLDNVVLNTTAADLKDLAWSAEWNGQKKTGKLDLAKGANATLDLAFDLPQEGGPRRVASPLILEITANGKVLRWERAIEVTRNSGVKSELPLTAAGAGKGTVTMTATADAEVLELVFDTTGIDLQADANGVALRCDLNVDARSYGSRLTIGSTDAITITTGAADGDGTTGKIMPWAFGTGYGMKFNEDGVISHLGTTGAHRQFMLRVPRSYLYRHEWAIGNGNSQLGINARLQFWQKAGGFGPDGTYSLTLNGKEGDDAEGLAVLELTDKPTARWTVVVW